MKQSAAFFLVIILAIAVTSGFQSTKAKENKIAISNDGSISPKIAPIVFDGEKYVLTDNIYASLAVYRGNIVIDGAGHAIQGSGEEIGIYLHVIKNVRIRNLQVKGFTYGIQSYRSEECVITGCTLYENALDGVKLTWSYGNLILNNRIKDNGDDGVQLYCSGNNSVAGNYFLNNGVGIQVNGIEEYSMSNTIKGNRIEETDMGIQLGRNSEATKVTYNTIEGSATGLELDGTCDNVVHHNNFLDNIYSVVVHEPDLDPYEENFWTSACWDDGVEGNYWSSYGGTDVDGDGVGDTPYSIYNVHDKKWTEFSYPLISQVDIERIDVAPNDFQSSSNAPEPQNSPGEKKETLANSNYLWTDTAVILGIFVVSLVIIIAFSNRSKRSKEKLTSREDNKRVRFFLIIRLITK